MARLTTEMLMAQGACLMQVNKFRRLFGGSTEITVELCLKHAQAFDWEWAIDNLLPSDLQPDPKRTWPREAWDCNRALARFFAERYIEYWTRVLT